MLYFFATLEAAASAIFFASARKKQNLLDFVAI